MEGFDFNFLDVGEITVNEESHDIEKAENDELRIQMAYNRIKSISNDWFIDEIGADLEELIGKECTSQVAEYGKQKIIQQLIFDDLWDDKDIYIKAEILNNVTIKYNIFLRLYQSDTEDSYSYEIEATLDLVKGVFIRFGWEPRR